MTRFVPLLTDSSKQSMTTVLSLSPNSLSGVSLRQRETLIEFNVLYVHRVVSPLITWWLIDGNRVRDGQLAAQSSDLCGVDRSRARNLNEFLLVLGGARLSRRLCRRLGLRLLLVILVVLVLRRQG